MSKIIIDQAIGLINSGARIFIHGKSKRISIPLILN